MGSALWNSPSCLCCTIWCLDSGLFPVPWCQWAPSWNRLQNMKYIDGEVSLLQHWAAAMFPESFSMKNLGGKMQYYCLLPTQIMAVLGAVGMNTRLQETPQSETKWFNTGRRQQGNGKMTVSTTDRGCRAISNLQAIRLSVGKLTRVHCSGDTLWMLIGVPEKEKSFSQDSTGSTLGALGVKSPNKVCLGKKTPKQTWTVCSWMFLLVCFIQK